MKLKIVCPRILEPHPQFGVIHGGPICEDLVTSWMDVSNIQQAAEENYSIFEVDTDNEAAVRAHADVYVLDDDLIQQGDVGQFVAWLAARGTRRGAFVAEFAKMRFRPEDSALEGLGPAVAGGLPE